MNSIEFVQSSKSKTILVVDGYEYYKKRENKLTTAWNCAQYQTLSCRTSAITSGEQLISTKEKLHGKALLELQTRLKVGILASKHSFRARIQVCGERWKIWRRMLQPKSIFICSQQQVRSFREKSTENWKRRWKTQLNFIKMKIQLPSSERWLPCRCQIEHYE